MSNHKRQPLPGEGSVATVNSRVNRKKDSQLSVENIKLKIGFKEVPKFEKYFGKNYSEGYSQEELEEYDPIVDGETLERMGSSYGMSFFRNKKNKWFFGSCNVHNPSLLFKIDKPSQEEINNFISNESTFYEVLFGLLTEKKQEIETSERRSIR